MLNDPFMVAAMTARAEHGKTFAEATAPYDPTSPGPHYRDSFVVTAGAHGGPRKNRAYGRLSNEDPDAFWIEVGTHDTPAHHTLARALDVMEAD